MPRAKQQLPSVDPPRPAHGRDKEASWTIAFVLRLQPSELIPPVPIRLAVPPALSLRNAVSNLKCLARAYHSSLSVEGQELIAMIAQVRGQVVVLGRESGGDSKHHQREWILEAFFPTR